MNFNISDQNKLNTKHIVIPCDRDNTDELKSLDIDGLDVKNLLSHIDILPKKGGLILLGDRIVELVDLKSDATYAEIKNTFTTLGLSMKSTAATICTVHRDYDDLKIKAIINGLSVSDYNIHLYQTENKDEKIETSYSLITKNKISNPDQLIASVVNLSEAQKMVMDIVNAPANKLIPEQLADMVADRLSGTSIHVKILDQDAIIKEGLHTVLAVNRGSEDPARFVIMEYRPEGGQENLPHFGMVGKGITFDTGGISLKKSTNMHYMKCDLGGGAALFGAMYVIAHEKPQAHITAIVPITENSIGTKAIKPGDVINSHSGKTIEIIDTDAEGRLILADGISYINKNYKIDYLIDIATLTGSIVQTLGYQSGGVFTKCDALAEGLCASGQEVSERLWRMPLWDDYKKDINSQVADVRNFSGRPIAGGISAAKFLESFTQDHPCWAHLDIAGVAFGKNPYTSEKAGTGYGPHMIYQWIKNTINNHNSKIN